MRTPRIFRVVPAFHAARPVPAYLIQCNAVVTGCESDVVLFASLVPLIPPLKAHIVILTAAQAAATAPNRSTTAVAERDKAREDVAADVEDIRHEVEKIAAAKPDTADAIVVKAGFKGRKRPVRKERRSWADYGPNTGTALCRIKAPKGSYSILWQASADGGKTWGMDDSGSTATYLFTGLTVGVTYLFRYRVKVGKVVSDWVTSAPFVVR